MGERAIRTARVPRRTVAIGTSELDGGGAGSGFLGGSLGSDLRGASSFFEWRVAVDEAAARARPREAMFDGAVAEAEAEADEVSTMRRGASDSKREVGRAGLGDAVAQPLRSARDMVVAEALATALTHSRHTHGSRCSGGGSAESERERTTGDVACV